MSEQYCICGKPLPGQHFVTPRLPLMRWHPKIGPINVWAQSNNPYGVYREGYEARVCSEACVEKQHEQWRRQDARLVDPR